MQRNVIALLKLQNECTALERQFHRKLFEMECAFNANHAAIYAKRTRIVAGEHEVSEDDCDFDRCDVEAVEKLLSPAITGDSAQGVPHFWLDALKNSGVYQINSDDEAILRFLVDVELGMSTEPRPFFELSFVFAPNPFLENSTLTKRFLLEFCDESGVPFCDEGPSIVESVGTEILWKATPAASDEPSFFQFFKSSRRDDAPAEADFNADDFEAGLQLKDHLIPSAVLFYLADVGDASSVSSNDSTEGHSGAERVTDSKEF